jgi:hypothetical protein
LHEITKVYGAYTAAKKNRRHNICGVYLDILDIGISSIPFH